MSQKYAKKFISGSLFTDTFLFLLANESMIFFVPKLDLEPVGTTFLQKINAQ